MRNRFAAIIGLLALASSSASSQEIGNQEVGGAFTSDLGPPFTRQVQQTSKGVPLQVGAQSRAFYSDSVQLSAKYVYITLNGLKVVLNQIGTGSGGSLSMATVYFDQYNNNHDENNGRATIYITLGDKNGQYLGRLGPIELDRRPCLSVGPRSYVEMIDSTLFQNVAAISVEGTYSGDSNKC